MPVGERNNSHWMKWHNRMSYAKCQQSTTYCICRDYGVKAADNDYVANIDQRPLGVKGFEHVFTL